MFIELNQTCHTLKGEVITPTLYRTANIIAISDNFILLSNGSEPRVKETKDQILQIIRDQETEAYNKMLKSYQEQTGRVYPL